MNTYEVDLFGPLDNGKIGVVNTLLGTPKEKTIGLLLTAETVSGTLVIAYNEKTGRRVNLSELQGSIDCSC